MALAKKVITANLDIHISDEPIVLESITDFSTEESLYILNNETERYIDAIEECNDVMCHLEELSETIEATLADGGMTVQTAAIVNTTLHHIGNSIGMEMAIEPGLELFIGQDGVTKEGAKEATQSTVSKIKDYIIKIWNAIKAFVVKWVNSLQSFYTIFITDYGRLGDRVKALLAKIKTAKPTKTNGKVTLPGAVFNNMSTNGNIKNCAMELERLATRADDCAIFSAMWPIITEEFETMNKYIEGNKLSDDIDHDNYAKSILSIITSTNKGPMKYAQTSEGIYTFTDAAPYIGELKAMVKLVTSFEEKALTASVSVTRDINSERTDTEVDALSHDALIDMLDSIVFSIGKVQYISVSTLHAFVAIKGSIGIADQLTAKMNKLSPEAQATKEYMLAKRMVMSFSGMTKLAMEPCLSYQKQTIASAKALFNYCLKTIAENYNTSSAKTA